MSDNRKRIVLIALFIGLVVGLGLLSLGVIFYNGATREAQLVGGLAGPMNPQREVAWRIWSTSWLLLISGFLLTFFSGVILVINRISSKRTQTESSVNSTESETDVSSTSSQSELEIELDKLLDMKTREVIDDSEYQRLRENLINRS